MELKLNDFVVVKYTVEESIRAPRTQSPFGHGPTWEVEKEDEDPVFSEEISYGVIEDMCQNTSGKFITINDIEIDLESITHIKKIPLTKASGLTLSFD